jgi:putative lysine transport system permease protein
MEGTKAMNQKISKTKALKIAAWIAGIALLVWLGVSFAETVRRCAAMERNPQGFVDSMVYMSIKGKDMLLTGVWTTVRIALLGTAIAFVLAILMVFLRIQEPDRRDSGMMKALKWLASHFARFYVFVIRGTPMMVQALIFYYFGFNLFKRTGMTVTEINHVWSFFISGLCTVALNSTAYLTEVLRGGILAVDKGQTEAARSLGMTNWQTMTKVVFPQAVKNAIPAIGNEFIINIKDSSVLSVIGVMDLMYATKSVSGIYFRSLEIYCVAALLYLVLTWLSSLLLKWLGKKLDMPVRGIPSSN